VALHSSLNISLPAAGRSFILKGLMKALVIMVATGALALGGMLGAQVVEKFPATQGCRLIVDAATGKVVVREGPCDVGRSPCSTFKVPLALMGYDVGILKNEHTPAWDYLAEYKSNRPEEQKKIDPTSWEGLSVVWYSQKLTRSMGMSAFHKYVNQFQYGNKDVTGDAGKDNGLTEAWLMSSLKISPDEQVAFIQKLLQRKLGVSERAYEMTEKVLPKFPAEDGWTLTGKTGSGFQRKADGTLDRARNEGWFVGWAIKGERRVIVVEQLLDKTPQEGYGGPRSRALMIQALPGIIRREGGR